MTGISGSTKIGNNVLIGGQVGISGHLNIGNNVKIAAKSGIMKNIEDNQAVGGYPADNIMNWHRNTLILKKLRKKKMTDLNIEQIKSLIPHRYPFYLSTS